MIRHMQHLFVAHVGGALGGDILHAAGTWGLGLPWGDINSTGIYSFSICTILVHPVCSAYGWPGSDQCLCLHVLTLAQESGLQGSCEV